MARRRSSSLPVSSESKRHRGDTDDNRISNLPDSTLGHILSLVPTKNAVSTGILSKRWKLLWTRVVNLDFCCPKNYTGDVQHFVQFVNYVLLLHKPGYLNRLSLTWETGCIPFYVNTWISTALARDVCELFVRVEISKLPIQVQSSIFCCERLQSLELNCNICIFSEIVFSLPRLERLKLISIYFQGQKAFCKLIDGCPVLKYLIIEMDIGKMIEHGHIIVDDGIPLNVDGSDFICKISSALLTHLDLFIYDMIISPTPQVVCCVELDAPSLQYIMLDGYTHSIYIKQKSLVLLDEADIHVNGIISEEPDYCNSFVDAVRAFRCAKTLTLDDTTIQALSFATIKMRTRFNRLTRLKVFIDLHYWSSLQHLIKLSDNLEVLIVNKYRGYDANDIHSNDSNWKKTNLVPRCLSNSLRTVSFDAYDGYPDELAMVDYILKHGSVLEVMHICFGETISDSKRKNELIQEISVLLRKSPICEVKFRDFVFQPHEKSYCW